MRREDRIIRAAERREARRARFRAIPVRLLVPNVITLLALCAGLTGIRMAVEGKLEYALAAIVFAAALDGIDGRVARMLKGTSRFGAELDSLADFFNFGVAPGLILYFWGLNELGNAGWIAAMIFAIAAALRLARFNVQIDDPNKPPYAANFFTGMPAPMGAIVVLLPIYLFFIGVDKSKLLIWFTFAYTLGTAFMMVSRIPVFSGKKGGKRVSPEMVLPLIVVVILVIALLISYPWAVLSTATVLYLASLPFGVAYYRRLAREHDASVAAAAAPGPAGEEPAAAPGGTAAEPPELPTRH
jgi:CDP-diacylglycerol--serine O-phosphatidyltransferase